MKKILIIAMLMVFAGLAVSSMLRQSGTCDEIAHHIPVGYVLLTKWDFKMDTSQPPLPRYLVALPLRLFMKIDMPDNKTEWRRPDRASFGIDFFYKYNMSPDRILLLSRIPVMIIGLLCGLVLFIWTDSLYGRQAALFSLFLYSLSPEILAHAGLATTDMIATFFIFLSVYSFWIFLCESSLKNTVLSGICLGMAQLAKYNSALLYPIFLAFVLFRPPAHKKSGIYGFAGKFLAIVLISFLTLWAGYGFEFQPLLKDAMRPAEKLDLAHSFVKKIMPGADQKVVDKFLLQTPVPLSSYVLGMAGVFRHSHEGHKTFFWGRWSGRANPLYFLVAYLLKTPIPMILFLVSGIFIVLRRKPDMAEWLIFSVITVFFAAASFSGLNIGLRHLLPVYPFCFMVAGRCAEALKKKGMNIAVVLLMAWYAVSTLSAWPHYLGYFNEAAGGPGCGYKYLRDSNVDWGQDLPALADYMRKNGLKEITLEYFGQAEPQSYGICYSRFTPAEFEKPDNKVYAISAQYLEHARWAGSYKPVAMAGYSIFIYDFTRKDAR